MKNGRNGQKTVAEMTWQYCMKSQQNSSLRITNVLKEGSLNGYVSQKIS